MNRTATTDELLTRIADGDVNAVNALLGEYRSRLRSLVASRLDPRLTARIDPSDVVQVTLDKASQRIAEYVVQRPLPFYPWLRQLAIDRMVELHRAHIRASRRSVVRELAPGASLSSVGRTALARQLTSLEKSPSQAAQQREEIERAQSAVERLSQADREVLVFRYLEQMTPREAASVLGISENAFAQRHLRALRRVRALLTDGRGDDDR